MKHTLLFSRKCHVNFRKHLVGEHTDRIIDIFREVWQMWCGVIPTYTWCANYVMTATIFWKWPMCQNFTCTTVFSLQHGSSTWKNQSFRGPAQRRGPTSGHGQGLLFFALNLLYFFNSFFHNQFIIFFQFFILNLLRSTFVMLLSWTTPAISRIHSSLKLPSNALRYPLMTRRTPYKGSVHKKIQDYLGIVPIVGRGGLLNPKAFVILLFKSP